VANSISVTLNGVQLRPGDDFTASNGTTIVLANGAALNDELVVIAFAVFNVANAVAKTGDTMTGSLLLPAGTASAPALTTSGDTNTGIFFPAADTIAFAEGGVESARLDANGNLGLGVTPSAWGSAYRALQIGDTGCSVFTANSLFSVNNAYNNGTNWIYQANTGAAVYEINRNTRSHIWYTAPSGTAGNAISFTQAMTLDASGRFLVGTTSAPTAVAGTVGAVGYASRAGTSGAFSGNNFNINWTGSAALYIDTTNLGNIQLSSDYRIKKNIETQTAPALERVMRLRAVTYELADYGELFKSDGVQREGFVAHEVQEVIPSGAEGQKDEANRIQNLKVDAILAVAVKAIQEQQALIQTLTARVAALEAQ
jgi:hypothetical protein